MNEALNIWSRWIIGKKSSTPKIDMEKLKQRANRVQAV